MKELIDQLDDNQKQGVLAHKGFIKVMAGAGTGKTHVLILRILNLVNNLGVNPSKIVANTFTKKAAEEMRERAVKYGGESLNKVKFQTLHSYAALLLRRYSSHVDLTNKFIIASQDEAWDIFNFVGEKNGVFGETPRKEMKEEAKEHKKMIDNCFSRMMLWKERNLKFEDIKKQDILKCNEEYKMTYSAYKFYEEALKERDLVDFADLILLSVRILKDNPDIRNQVSKNIEFLLIDEFQDVNEIQIEFIDLLSSYHRNLFIVGDDDQSLYSFRGSIKNIMKDITEKKPELTVKGITNINLITNRRCTEEILEPAVKLVDYNSNHEKEGENKVLNSGRHGKELEVICYSSDVTEGIEVVKKIKELNKKGVDLSEIAVLGRTGESLKPIVNEFNKKLISFKSYIGKQFSEKEVVKDLVAYFQLAINPSLDIAFKRIAARPTRGIGPAAVNNILDVSKEKDIPIHEAILFLVENNPKTMKNDKRDVWVKFSNDLKFLSIMIDEGELSDIILNYILHNVGYYKYIEKKPKELLDNYIEDIKDMDNLSLLNEDPIKFLEQLSLDFETGESSNDNEKVHIGTLHSSKGLEWRHVFLVAFEEGTLPHNMAKNSYYDKRIPDYLNTEKNNGSLEEERRLAHVGITRAKDNVYISYAKMRMDIRIQRFKNTKPSSFIKEADLKLPTKIIGATEKNNKQKFYKNW
jgi:DNA helicase-2/ATP-dependent DNA helicase PcrA